MSDFLTLTSVPLCRGLCISRFSSPQQPADFELQTRTAPSAASWKRGLKCSARSSASQPRSIWNLSESETRELNMFEELRTTHHLDKRYKTLNPKKLDVCKIGIKVEFSHLQWTVFTSNSFTKSFWDNVVLSFIPVIVNVWGKLPLGGASALQGRCRTRRHRQTVNNLLLS